MKMSLVIATVIFASIIDNLFIHSISTINIPSNAINNLNVINHATNGKKCIYVCENKWCQEKGGESILQTFKYLTPPGILIVGVNCLGRCNKGPNIKISNLKGEVIEISTVRSVEKVVDILESYLELKINSTTVEVLTLNCEGNVYLTNGEVDKAIECYDKALAVGDKEQDGVLYLMRGSAILQRAYAYRLRYKDLMHIVERVLPSYDIIKAFYGSLDKINPTLKSYIMLTFYLHLNEMLVNLDISPVWNELKTSWKDTIEGPVVASGDELLSRVSFCWSVYEYSLMKAIQDILTSTIMLPNFAPAWSRAGEALGEMLLFRSAVNFYFYAIRLDSQLTDTLLPIIQKLIILERLVENAEMRGYSREAVLQLIDE